MGINFGDYLIDSGHYDITPEQEREREHDCPICNGDCSAVPGGPPYNCPTYHPMDDGMRRTQETMVRMSRDKIVGEEF